MTDRATPREQSDHGRVARWECHCQSPAVLLGTHDMSGTIHIKVRDRYWHIIGLVRTACPRCGTEHVLEPKATVADLPDRIDRFGIKRS